MKRIVVGIDGSAGSRAALDWALAEAKLHDARLEPVLAWEYPVATEYYIPTNEDLAAAATEHLALIMGEIDVDGVDVDASVVEGNPAQALLDVATDADLLVVGSRGHNRFVGMLLGSVSLRVVTHAHCPVVVVPAPEPSGTDGSDT